MEVTGVQLPVSWAESLSRPQSPGMKQLSACLVSSVEQKEEQYKTPAARTGVQTQAHHQPGEAGGPGSASGPGHR